MKDSVLQVAHLVKTFPIKKTIFSKAKEFFTAVNNISFTLAQGEILGLLGTNGAGKTTTIQMLLSLMTPTSGSIYYFGKDFFTHRSEILQYVSFASTYVKLPSRLTISENLDIYGRLYGLSPARRAEKIKHYLIFFDMWSMRDKETGMLSAGELTRVMLAKAFIADPKVVLLDEPTASLDPDIAHDVRRFVLSQQKEHGVSILFTSHNMDEVAEVCNRVLVLKKGTIIADATPAQLAASVATARVELIINEGLPQLKEYLTQKNFSYSLEENNLTRIIIETDEQKIPVLLSEITRAGVVYSYISIDKPTLEDYFLHIAQETRNTRNT